MLQASPVSPAFGHDLTTVSRLRPHVQGDTDITLFPLEAVDWYIAVATPRRALRLQVSKESLAYGLLVLLLLTSVSLLVLLSRTLRRVRQLSVRDGLTGAYNRRHFDECPRIEFARLRRSSDVLALLLIDLDYFKRSVRWR